MANLAFVVGKKYSGKTTLLKRVMRYHLDAHDDVRFVVLDRNREFSAAAYAPHQGRVIVLPGNRFSIEQAAKFALDQAPCTFVVPEIDLYAPNHQGGLKVGSSLHAIVHYGRHDEVALICDSRRGANVHGDIRALSDVIFFFRHTEPNDLKWIEERCGGSWAEHVRALPVCRACVFGESGPHVHQHLRFED